MMDVEKILQDAVVMYEKHTITADDFVETIIMCLEHESFDIDDKCLQLLIPSLSDRHVLALGFVCLIESGVEHWTREACFVFPLEVQEKMVFYAEVMGEDYLNDIATSRCYSKILKTVHEEFVLL